MAAADDEKASAAPSPRIKVRIESLSDLVFGLALSIGSIILVGKPPGTGQDIASNVALFGFGFLIIVMTWLGYSRTMAVLPVETPFALVANLVLLFIVAIEPYLFYVLIYVKTSGLADAASVAYALDVGGMFLMQAALARMVVAGEKAPLQGAVPLHPAVLARFRTTMKLNVVVGLIYVISALPVFWMDTPIGYLRFDLWFSSFLFLARGRPRAKAKAEGDPSPAL
ncbi:MAG TPA: hypothetical protein VGS04_03445 [Nitrososphaerales archaeon]|nr:hypothetical protein [Nitrososphaerales archaeon]